MVPDELEILGCPYCRTPLVPAGAGRLRCSECGHLFALRDGVPVLLRDEDTTRFAAFGEAYRRARLCDGWRPMRPEQARALPYGDPPGCPALYWQVRRESYGALMRLLQRRRPRPDDGVVVDLGAGVGWLSYRLSLAGYRTVAIDASLDESFGLGAALVYGSPRVPFLRAQGDLEWPPLRAGRIRLAILNASLHYADNLSGTLRRLAECLTPGGKLIILDTPISRVPQAGTGRGDRHLGHSELEEALRCEGFCVRWHRIVRRPHWWMHQAKAWLKRTPGFSFPMIEADRLSHQA